MSVEVAQRDYGVHWLRSFQDPTQSLQEGRILCCLCLCTKQEFWVFFPATLIRRVMTFLFTRANSNSVAAKWGLVSILTPASHPVQHLNRKETIPYQGEWFQSRRCVWKWVRLYLVGTFQPPAPAPVPSQNCSMTQKSVSSTKLVPPCGFPLSCLAWASPPWWASPHINCSGCAWPGYMGYPITGCLRTDTTPGPAFRSVSHRPLSGQGTQFIILSFHGLSFRCVCLGLVSDLSAMGGPTRSMCSRWHSS